MTNGHQVPAGAAPVPQGVLPAAPPAATDLNFSESSTFVLWSKYEDVAMHFNDLIMKLRTQALAGLAGVVTVSGLAVSFTGKSVTATEWEVLFGTSAFLSLAWLALFILDLGYYNRLLSGAVKAIHAHEDLTQNAPPIEKIILSRRISDSAKYHTWFICGFYLLVFVGLCAGDAVTFQKWSAMTTPSSSSSRFEFKFDRAATEGVDVKIVPAPSAVGGTQQTPTNSATPAPKATAVPTSTKVPATP